MKKKIYAGIATCLLLLGTAAYSQATMIDVTWQSEVTSVTGTDASNIYSVGDIIYAKGTYDDTSTIMHDYYDGANGIAEAGGGDDTVYRIFDINDHPSYSMFADVVWDITGVDSLTTFDNSTNNESLAYDSLSGVSYLHFISDGLIVSLISSHGGYITWSDAIDSPNQVVMGSVSITKLAASPVPEPATMLLFGTGLAGLTGTRLRRKKKA